MCQRNQRHYSHYSYSGDGTLSVIDVRSKKPVPVAQSEDQEDELLSIASIRGGEKTVVGTQQGVLSIFNRSSGWGDCVDRVPGCVIFLFVRLPSSMISGLIDCFPLFILFFQPPSFDRRTMHPSFFIPLIAFNTPNRLLRRLAPRSPALPHKTPRSRGRPRRVPY